MLGNCAHQWRLLFDRPRARASSPGRPTRELLVDVSVIARHDARTGIQRVVRAIWLHLLEFLPDELKLRPVYAGKWQSYVYAPSDFLEHGLPSKLTSAHHIFPQEGDIFLGLDLAAHLIPRHEKQLARWRGEGVSINFLIYDLLPFLHPEWFSDRTCRNFTRWLRVVSRQADQAICISNQVAKEMDRWLDMHGGKHCSRPITTVVRLGADIEASGPSGGLTSSVSSIIAKIAAKNSILMIGTIEPRKGYDDALAAFEYLWARDEGAPALVIVGKPGWKTEALQNRLKTHVENGRRLFWLQDASDEVLAGLFLVVKGLLAASRGEGYGLPLIEAARSGLPVLARDLPVFRELALPNVRFFSNAMPSALGLEIGKFVESMPQGVDNIQLASWRDATEDLLRALVATVDTSFPLGTNGGR